MSQMFPRLTLHPENHQHHVIHLQLLDPKGNTITFSLWNTRNIDGFLIALVFLEKKGVNRTQIVIENLTNAYFL